MSLSAEPLTPRRTRIKLDLPDGAVDAEVEDRPPAPAATSDPVTLRDTPPLGLRTEFWNTLTHGSGAIAAVLGAGLVLPRLVAGETIRGSTSTGATPVEWTAWLVYLAALVYLYAASGLSHYYSWRLDRPKRGFWRRQDQVGILAVAFGSFAPLAVHSEGIGRAVLPLMGLVVGGLLIALLTHRRRTLSPLYLAHIGWLPPLALFDLIRLGGAWGVLLGFGGCAAYLGGLFFLMNDARRWWFHPVWHLTAVTGSVLHFVFLTTYCL